MSLATAAEVAEWLQVPVPADQELNRMNLCISSSVEKVEHLAGRRFSNITESRVFDTTMLKLELLVDDFQSISRIDTRLSPSDDYEELASTGYESRRGRNDRPYTSLVKTDGYYWPVGSGAAKITGEWGWPATPGATADANGVKATDAPPLVKLATIMAAAGMFQSNKNPTGQAVAYDNTDLPSLLGYDVRILAHLDAYKSSGRMFG